MSSLSLGAHGRCEQVGSDTFYLPSCNLLVRRSAFLEAGGFREQLHVAEDVDLSWRLRDRGCAIAYVPGGRVQHEHRNRLWPFLRRRFEYGTSEGVLAVLHPARRKRMVLPPVLVAAALLGAGALLARWWPPAVLGAAAVALDAVVLWRRMRRVLTGLGFRPVLRARLRALGTLLYYLSFHLVRYYGPPLVVASVAWPRFAVLAAALALWPAVVDHRMKRPALAFPAFAAFYVGEHAAYAAGVFRGCLRARTFRSYVPAIVRELQ
jgi:cellulose synthase/poly-beta-1,6-N-acetylglucosamine synthase-like glycosyltransferase